MALRGQQLMPQHVAPTAARQRVLLRVAASSAASTCQRASTRPAGRQGDRVKAAVAGDRIDAAVHRDMGGDRATNDWWGS
jgi:hypothetical protein